MANPTVEIRGNDATSDGDVAKVDMKLEMVREQAGEKLQQ
jgi:transcriptional regulator GlxA family with amidase domain